MKRVVTALAASLVAFTAHAIAQDIPTEQQLLHACGGDVDRSAPACRRARGALRHV
jgi:hypothetical protein